MSQPISTTIMEKIAQKRGLPIVPIVLLNAKKH
jgi:hypothetical protein